MREIQPRPHCTARNGGRLNRKPALEETLVWISATPDPCTSPRAETDAEVVLTAIGQVARPSPKAELLHEVMNEIIEELRGTFRLRSAYHKPDAPAQIIEPHGVQLGPRHHLVAR